MLLKNFKERVGTSCRACLSKCSLKSCIISTLKIAIISYITVVIFYFVLREKVIEDMLLSNPKAIIKAVEKMRDVETRKSQEESKKKVPEVYAKIKSDASIPFIGNEHGTEVVTVFTDYNCGYCKKLASELFSLIQKNKNVRVNILDFPVLSRESFVAAQVSTYIALKHKNVFEKYYRYMSNVKQANEQTLKGAVKNSGLSLDIIEKAQKDNDSMAILRKNHEFGSSLGLGGTPGLIVYNGISEPVLISGYAPLSTIEATLSKK